MTTDDSKGTVCTLLFRRVGDSLLATPAIRAIKRRFPNQKLMVFIEPQVRRVFELNPWVDQIVDTGKSPPPFHLAKHLRLHGRPDITVDFLSDPRTAVGCFLSRAKHRVGFALPLRSLLYHQRIALQDPLRPIYSATHKLKLARALGADSDSVETEFNLKTTDLEFARDWRIRASIPDSQRIIAVFPYSRRAYKRWPTDHYVELCKKLRTIPNVIPLLISGPGEAGYCATIAADAGLDETLSPAFRDLGEMAALLSISSLYIGNDGGPKHLAVAVKTPTVTIFQNDPPEYWTPPDHVHHIALSSNASFAGGILPVAGVLEAVLRMLNLK